MDRYNPQSIEKQARKWPALLSKQSIAFDLEVRLKQIKGIEKLDWFWPVIEEDIFDTEYICEYGNDACRLAFLSSDNNTKPISLLDSAYKNISKVYNLFISNKSSSFDSKYWLKAVVQAYDHAVLRKKPALAVALINSALNNAKPSENMSSSEKSLVLSTLYPFMPILSFYLSKLFKIELQPVNKLISQTKYTEVVFKISGGGWHREIFDKENFNSNPKKALYSLKWVKKAVGKSNIKLCEINGGIEIVFSK